MKAGATRRSLATLGTVVALLWPRGAAAQMPCTYDTDCTAAGTACGTDVCSWAMTPHQCVPAGTDPGQCHGDVECKCAPEGATCTQVYCSFTAPPDSGISEADAADAEADTDGEADLGEADDDAGGMGDVATSEGGDIVDSMADAEPAGPAGADAEVAQSATGMPRASASSSCSATACAGTSCPSLYAIGICVALRARRRTRRA
jgi:hypothetical protein